jgi:hypothetical protein
MLALGARRTFVMAIGCHSKSTHFTKLSAPRMRATALRASLWVAAVLSTAACTPETPAPAGARLAAAEPTPTIFPLHVEAGKRFLLDGAGRPFLLQGDSAWSLIAQPTDEEVEVYLQKRHAQGFNTLLVNLIEHHYSTAPPNDAAGDAPFLVPGDFSTPNEKYFAHADWVLRKASEYGFLVLLAPAFLGYEHTNHGWYEEMHASSLDKLRAYGEFLGSRYRGYTNIVWVHGGDRDPPDKAIVNAIAEGIRQTDPGSLATAECGPDGAAIEIWGGKPWLNLNTVYSWHPIYNYALTQYERPEKLPFFLIESHYENDRGIDEVRVRTQAYQAVLSGATGQVFGNIPVWFFDGTPPFPTSLRWREQLDTQGARSMSLLKALLAPRKWWTLVPDTGRGFLVAGRGSDQQRAVGAVASDGSFAIVYIPSPRSVVLNTRRLSGKTIAATWIDPSDGSMRRAAPSGLSVFGRQLFSTPPVGGQDWLLLLESK